MGLGFPELMVVLVIVIVLFGANRLPQIGKGIGEGIRNFKHGFKEPPEIDITPKSAADSKTDAPKP